MQPIKIAAITIVTHALFCFVQVDAQAQVAPEFEPIFQGGTYTVYVDEDTQPGDVVTNIRARDVIQETLVYRFYPWTTNHDPPWIRPDVPNPDGRTVFNQDLYTINEGTGTVTAGSQVQSYIRLSIPPDNFIPAFTYNCTAWFASNPMLRSTIFVTFVSRDVNEVPTFTSSSRSFDILFTQPVGYVVTRFTASDNNDRGPAGEFLFSMTQSVPDRDTGVTYFAINQYSGDLYVLHSLPRIHRFRYQLVITVQDEGDTPLSSSISVEIFLNAPPEQPPAFSTGVYVGFINEGSIPQSAPGFVVAVNATDPTGLDPTSIGYSIVESEPEGDNVIFNVEQTSGQVTVYGPIDRERESRYLFHVQAEKLGLGLTSTATIVINILDVNEPPLFLNNHYIAWVSEHANIGEPVHASISAVDYDEGQNGLIQYSISGISGRATVHGGGTNEMGSFRIDSFTGAIFVNTDLEREMMTNGIHYYEITVTVTDGGLLTDDALVSINITDVNDNPPYFVPFQYADSFPENQPAQLRFNFQAFDMDERDQATLRFHLEGPFNERFSVTTGQTIHSTDHTRPATETQGQFFVSVPLDREERDVYNLLIVAEDITLTPLLGYANVTINVQDLNDNSPIFDPDFKVTFNVTEGSLLPEQLFLESLSVTDADFGINAEVDFSITGGSPASYINHFTVVSTGSRTADLRITQEFDREMIDFYQFTITATDRGTPQLTDTISRCLNVIDINDCPPDFNPMTYTYSICEGFAVGTELGTITATDCDIGNNGMIHYTIESTEGLGLFTIDEVTGVFSIAAPIDYEQTGSSIVVEVVGRDLGSPPNSAIATVTISICDCNDNGPIVSRPDDGSCIVENSPDNTIVRTFSTRELDTSPSNTDHVYEIESGGLNAAGDQVLCIPNNRVPTITVCGEIDKEEPLDYITVTVRISNPGNADAQCSLPIPSPMRISYNICVSGVNDNLPEFVDYTIAVSIEECGGVHLGSAAGARVARVEGFDDDRSENTMLTYTLAPLHPNFVLDRTSGVITVSTLGLDYETATSHSLAVSVEDGGSPNLRSAMSVAITVTVIDCNDNAPISPGFFSGTIDEHSPIGTVVLTMTYQDADTLSPYGMAAFYIVGGAGASFNHFTLSTSGVLTVRDDIDRESDIPSLITNGECQAVYELTVELRDNVGGNPMETLTNRYTVVVYVNDINDNSPMFDPTTLTIMVAENNDPPTAIDHALATDADCGTNAELRYQITSQSSTATDPLPNPYFQLVSSVDPTIRAIQMLDRESDDNQFTIVVTATDQGTPAASSGMYTLTVIVSDVNDHNPVLACPANALLACTFNVPEDTAINSVVVDRITSTDQDIDPAHNTIAYSITNNPTPPFSIDPSTGIISTTGMLDCETTREYYLTVVGTDSSSDPDHIRRGSIVVHIVCIDVNDNCPVLESGSMFTASIPENMAAGTLITLNPSIFVTDTDITAPFQAVQYALVAGGANFAIDPSTAEITSTAMFDREAVSSYTITFRVTNTAPNCGTPGFVDGTVVITIEDRNDNTPIWIPIPPITLQECVGVSTVIVYTRPTDADINENGRIYYRFGENHDEDFQINYETGDIRVFQSLDRERMDSYSFDVIATDGGDVPNSASTTLSITILDCNDETPVCPASVARFSVIENSPAGMEVGSFLATDDDIGVNEILTYTIVSGNSAGHFRIRLPSTPGIDIPITIETGDVRVDREATSSVTLTIQAVDGGATPRFCTQDIIIDIIDENDNCPMFLNLVTTYNIREDLSGDEEITRLVATDIDVDERNRVPITYAITSITPTADIIIDSVSGGLHTQSVDYERTLQYSITISAADSGTPDPLTCSATITVNIIDVNDNPPIAPDIYVNVIENSPAQTFVGRVVGTDVDTGLGGSIRYTVIDGNIGNAFAINELDGVVTVMNNVIDRETLDEYTLTIQLRDLGNPSLSSTSMVFITVLDDNDCIPMFPQPSYTWTISEGSLPGQAFIDVAASDCDLTTNAEIDYFVDSVGNIGGAFEATAEGHIRTVTTLDRETDNFYQLTVLSFDRGVPQLMHMTTVNITVTDINDNTPVIIPFLSTAEVHEHDSIGDFVHQFSGNDTDLGINALHYFNLSDTYDLLPFALNSSGYLTISRDIDLESITNRQCELPHYFLTVEIIDNGTVDTVDHARSSVGHINITIRDINDHIPRFTDRELRICINENNTVDVPVYEFTATDDDCEPQNTELYFFIVGGSSADYFRVDVTTGTLRLAQKLDRETQDLHEIFVAVTNFNMDPANNNYQLAMVSTTSICVEDSNDNPPQCLLNPYVVAISQDIEYGEDFSTIFTTDRDIGNHSVAQYELITEGSSTLPFLIERDTGILTTIAVFHDKVGEMYNARIRVYDNYRRVPSLETICDLRVYVVSDEFRIIVTISIPIEFVRANISIITNIFQEATECFIGIDAIRPRTSDGDEVLDVSQTDIIIHGIDPLTREIKPRDPLIDIIDRRFTSINASIFSAMNAPVLGVRPYPTGGSDEQDLLIFYIIIVFLITIALIACCCFICCYFWERRRRKLAHKELKSVVSLDQFEHTDNGVYQNPLWVQPYAEWQEESQSQEIVIDVEDDVVSEANMIYASQELEIPVIHPGEEEDSDDEQKNVEPPNFSDNYRKLGRFGDEFQSTKHTMRQSTSSSSYQRTSEPQIDSYQEVPGNLGGSVTSRTTSYKKTTSFKRTIEVPETTDTVTVTHTTSPIETEDDKAGLITDDQMITYNFDEDD